MAEEVIDIIHKLSYIVESDSLKEVSNEIAGQISRLDTLGKRAQKLSEAYDKTAANEVAKRERIKKLIIETQRAIEKEGDAIEHTLTKNKELERSLQKQIGIVGALEQKMQLLRDRRDRAFDIDRIKAYNREIAKGENELRSLRGGGVDKQAGGGIFAPIVGGNLVAGLVTQAGAALKGFATDIVSTTAKYEKLSALLANTLGGKQAGADAFKLLTDFAADTPFQLDELTASYLKLVNRGIKPTKEELIAFGDIAAAQGKSFDQFTEAVLDATTGEFERLKEFGIKASQAGDKVNLTFGNITKTVPKTGDAIKKALLEIRNEAPGIAGAMKVISNTVEGQLSNLADGFDRLKNSLGSGFQNNFKQIISEVSDLVGWLNDLVEVPVEEKLEAERVELNALFGILVDTNTENEVRVKVMQELNQKYPELLKNIDLEHASSNELLTLLNGINLAYEVRIKKAGAARLAEKAAKSADKELDSLTEALTRVQELLAKAGLTGVSITSQEDIVRLKEEGKISRATADIMDQWFRKVIERREEYNAKVKESIDLTKTLGNISEAEDKRVVDRIAALNKIIDDLIAKNKELKKEGGFLNSFAIGFNEQAIKNARAELIGLQNGLNAAVPPPVVVPKVKKISKAVAEKTAKDLVEEVQRKLNVTQLELDIKGLDVKLTDPNFKLSAKEIASLKKKLEALLQTSGISIPKKSDPSSPQNAGIADLDSDGLISRKEKVIAYYDTITNASKEAADAIIGDEIRILDAQIVLQNRRVEQAGRIADRGNAELLQREEKRLAELQKKRDNYAKAEMITNNLLTISNAVLAVAKAAAAGAGYASIATVAAVIAALVAGYSVVRTITNDTGGFKEGGYTGDGDTNKPAGVVHGKEFVMHAKATERYRPLLEEMNRMRHPKVPPVLIDTWTPKYLHEQQAAAQVDYRKSFSELKKEIVELREAVISRPNTSLTVDKDGIAASVEQVIIRRERNRNL